MDDQKYANGNRCFASYQDRARFILSCLSRSGTRLALLNSASKRDALGGLTMYSSHLYIAG